MNVIIKNGYVLMVNYIYNFRDTCSSVEMLKGYMARESLGTSAPNYHKICQTSKW